MLVLANRHAIVKQACAALARDANSGDIIVGDNGEEVCSLMCCTAFFASLIVEEGVCYG